MQIRKSKTWLMLSKRSHFSAYISIVYLWKLSSLLSATLGRGKRMSPWLREGCNKWHFIAPFPNKGGILFYFYFTFNGCGTHWLPRIKFIFIFHQSLKLPGVCSSNQGGSAWPQDRRAQVRNCRKYFPKYLSHTGQLRHDFVSLKKIISFQELSRLCKKSYPR